MALTPNFETFQSWTTVKDAAAWAGVKESLWKQMAKELGDDEIDNLLLVAGIADEDYRSAANRIDPPISALQRSSLNLLFNGIKGGHGSSDSHHAVVGLTTGGKHRSQCPHGKISSEWSRRHRGSVG